MVAKINEEPKDFESAIAELNDTKKQMRKTFLENAGIIVGVFLILAVLTISFTDISITSFDDMSRLALRYIVILFVTYQIYINTADSGSKRGVKNEIYIAAENAYNGLKERVIKGEHQNKLPVWCATYIRRELEHTRTLIVATIGMSYEELVPYLSRDEASIKNDKTLSKIQKNTILKAMSVKPIKLTPAMIMNRNGRGNRSPLGMDPKTKRNITFGWKLFTSMMTTAFIVLIAFEIVFEPSWNTVIYMVASILPVILNGFGGYQFGYENIVYDTVDYMGAQGAVLEEFLKEVDHENKDQCSDEEGV